MSIPVSTQLQHFQERLFGHLHPAYVLHFLLALFLLFQQLALTGDIASVALGQNILASGRNILPGHDAAADSRLKRYTEKLARNDFLKLGYHRLADIVSLIRRNDTAEGIYRHIVHQDIEFNKFPFPVTGKLVIQRSVSATAAFHLVVESGQHAAQGHFVFQTDALSELAHGLVLSEIF